MIFWLNGRPVGQGEVTSGSDGSLDLTGLADAAIAPAARREALRPHRPTDPALEAAPSTSVIVCTRDRPEALARCLASLPRQSRPPDEIIVVDNASRDDRTRRAASAAGVVYIREDRPGLDIARNTGALAAQGELVIYTDDDVVLHPKWLERLVDAFEPGVDAVTGLVLPGELRTASQLHFERFWSFGKGFLRQDFGASFFALDRTIGCPAWEVGAGASMAFRARVFRDVGLFDERLDVGAAGCSGDSEYWHRLLHAGRTCRYEPAAVAHHFHREDDEGLRQQIFFYMRGHVMALLIQFERTRNLGNLRRAVVTLPFWYARQIVRPYRSRDASRRYLGEEIRGCLSGYRLYLRTLAGRLVRPHVPHTPRAAH